MQTGNPRIDSSTAKLVCGSDEAGRYEVPPALAARLKEAAFVVASDEAGYGAWAGPLVVVSVCVPRDWVGPKGLTDSKKLTEARRETLFELLIADPGVQWVSHFTGPTEIDKLGVYRANIRAHIAVHGSRTEAGCLHVADGNLDLGPNIVSQPKADALVPAVSAASIIAKVRRDREMVGYDRTYPGYDFAGSKGYGVPKHQAGLSLLGPCKIHRMSYAPVAAAVQRLAVIEQDDAMALMDELPQE